MRRINLVSFWLIVSMGFAAAATITAEPCVEKCFPSYEHVEITLTGRVTVGDLANLKKQYAFVTQVECLNRAEPGRYVMIPADKVADWQEKKWRQSQASQTPASPNDATAAKECLDGIAPNRPGYVNGMLLIDSAGGDLDEAMAIGRWLRENRIGVEARGDCASACVWILASGLIRNIWPHTEVRVHRPYLASDTADVQPRARLQKLLQESKNYFDEMGIPPEIADRMFSTPPDTATSLSDAQISYYRLNQLDLGLKEEIDFARAQDLGISREEYMGRMQTYNDWNKRSPCPIESMNEKDTLAYVHCMSERAKKVGLEE